MPCIYCANPATSDEHWLPRSLGDFGDEQILRERVCEDCNGTLGREVDQEWIRTGPEGVFRAGLGIEGRRGAATGNPFYYRAAADHPVHAINVADGDEPHWLWEMVPGPAGEPQARLLEQLVLLPPDGGRALLPFNTNWNPDVLRDALRRRGLAEAQLAEVYVDDDKRERARVLLSAVFPGFSAESFSRDGAGGQQRRIQFANHLREPYFRGIVKIAFHGALKLLPHLDGAAPQFERVRRWVRHGERPNQPFWSTGREPIIDGLGDGVMLRDWGHVIAVESDYMHVIVRMQFFIGPPRLPPTWRVHLGRNPARIAARIAEARYCRYVPQSRDSRDGEILNVDAIERVRPFSG